MVKVVIVLFSVFFGMSHHYRVNRLLGSVFISPINRRLSPGFNWRLT